MQFCITFQVPANKFLTGQLPHFSLLVLFELVLNITIDLFIFQLIQLLIHKVPIDPVIVICKYSFYGLAQNPMVKNYFMYTN